MNEDTFEAKKKFISELPSDLSEWIDFGLYGGVEQYYIIGVDGTLAQLGHCLPDFEYLREILEDARKMHSLLVRRHGREMKR